MKIFPESALKPLQKLLWLSLDNNKIEEIRLEPERILYSIGDERKEGKNELKEGREEVRKKEGRKERRK